MMELIHELVHGGMLDRVLEQARVLELVVEE